MTRSNIRLGLKETRELLTAFNDAFTPPLLDTDGIDGYINKLSRYAYFLECEKDGDTLGFVAYYLNDSLKQLYVTLLGVRNGYQGRGIGTELMAGTLETAKEAGCTSIGLEVSKDNGRARNYYMKHGFEITEDRGGKYLLTKFISL